MKHSGKIDYHNDTASLTMSPQHHNDLHLQQQKEPASNTTSNSFLYNTNFNSIYNFNLNKKFYPAVPGSIPHHGSLCRVVDDNDDFLEPSYIIEIDIEGGGRNNNDKERVGENDTSTAVTPEYRYHELVFIRKDYEFALRVFAILDSESVSFVDKDTVREFVYRRCPVFWRRDEDLGHLGLNYNSKIHKDGSHPNPAAERKPIGIRQHEKDSNLTFDEIWNSVFTCGSKRSMKEKDRRVEATKLYDSRYLGLEGWMVFFRFIALAQYLEAKRRFSARHLQQTMRHRNSPRGSEMVVVNVPPAEPPVPLTPFHLAQYERNNKAPLPAPELDLDHSLLAAHDCHSLNMYNGKQHHYNGHVKISLFGSTSTTSASSASNNCSSHSSNLEFAVLYSSHNETNAQLPSSSSSSQAYNEVVVRRSMADMKWLEETFTSHKVLGGTLCGRILPPFPGSTSSSSMIANKMLSSHFQNRLEEPTSSIIPSSLSIIQTTGSAMNVAAAGVGCIRDAAKSFVGSYLGSSATSVFFKKDEVQAALMPSPSMASANQQQKASSSHNKQQLLSKKKKSFPLSLPENYYNPHSPAGKTRQLERYLNYLLEHPALSTSFPLNTILKASQSGVEAAKQCLDECTRVSKEMKNHTPQLVDGKVGIPFWPQQGSNFSLNSPNFAWVRTAAQAAIALRVHGMLETSGLPSASARLQHASLPSFGHFSIRTNPGWDDIEAEAGSRIAAIANNAASMDGNAANNNFEEGVVNDDGFDLLPLPVPAPERRILTAGSNTDVHYADCLRPREERFHYGTPSVQGRYTSDNEEDIESAFLGDVAVDENIDKLREVIGSVDNTLSRCLASSGGIGKAHRELQTLHLSIVSGLDSWLGMRGKFVSQRSLLKGVTGIEQSLAIAEEGDLAMIDDLSWQTSLASSAVAAAEDVRAAVRASRTASNARATASSAALSAQQACEQGDFATIDDARAAQTRASIAQSHAIHAAVVEHEAKTVKRRATLALAHDVKTWNIHRKREMLKSCIAYAKSQHEASRRAVDSWSNLRDGFIGTTLSPATVDRRQPAASSPINRSDQRRFPQMDQDEATATFFDNSHRPDGPPAIMAVEHNVLSAIATNGIPVDHMMTVEMQRTELFLPLAEASPIPEDEELDDPFRFYQDSRADTSTSVHGIGTKAQRATQDGFRKGGDINTQECLQASQIVTCHPNSPTHPIIAFQFEIQRCDVEKVAQNQTIDQEAVNNVDEDVVGDLINFRRCGFNKHENVTASISGNDDTAAQLSESMQSLVDGLMSWGGGFEAEEEHFALPAGMATSIALEGSGAMGAGSLL